MSAIEIAVEKDEERAVTVSIGWYESAYDGDDKPNPDWSVSQWRANSNVIGQALVIALSHVVVEGIRVHNTNFNTDDGTAWGYITVDDKMGDRVREIIWAGLAEAAETYQYWSRCDPLRASEVEPGT